MAIIALVTSAVSLTMCPLISIVGLCLGWMALLDIRKSAGRLQGRGLAIVAMAIGGAVLLLTLLGVGFFFFAVLGNAAAPAPAPVPPTPVPAPTTP